MKISFQLIRGFYREQKLKGGRPLYRPQSSINISVDGKKENLFKQRRISIFSSFQHSASSLSSALNREWKRKRNYFQIKITFVWINYVKPKKFFNFFRYRNLLPPSPPLDSKVECKGKYWKEILLLLCQIGW